MKPKFGFRKVRESDKMADHGLNERVREINEYRAKRKQKREERQREKDRTHQEYLARFSSCPFCASKNLGYQENRQQTDWVRCLDCDATGPCSDGEDDAIERW